MSERILKELPMLVLRGKTMMPGVYTSIDVGRVKSLTSVGKSLDYDSEIFVCSQINSAVDDPTADDLYKVGVICSIRKVTQLTGPNLRIYIKGLSRARIAVCHDESEYFLVSVCELEDISTKPIEENAYLSVAKSKYKEYADSSTKLPKEGLEAASGVDDAGLFSFVAAYYLPLKEYEKQKLLEERDVIARLESLSVLISGLLELTSVEKSIADRVKQSVEKSQKEYYLREQIKAIHAELGDDEDEIEKLKSAILDKKMPKEIEDKALKELQRMGRMSASSPDFTVLRTYLDFLLETPFNEVTKDTEDLNKAINVLNQDHFGLQKVKERIIEYLAVMKITGKISGPILCLQGPPGVGKTSVATSIARALNRKFVRMSLGGVKDEAEIRGHRKTYIGAMPGRIMTGLKSAGVSNPVFLLDEIDKISSDLRGDPASALLEVLDPEQNKTFRDRYLEIPYDLSKVLFITTANSLSTIPQPLLDRMEVIELDGYTQEEKVEIAKQYLIPKRLVANGLRPSNISFSDEALVLIIKGYTLESGVRNLERKIDAIMRKVATKLAEKGKISKQVITERNVEKFLGQKRYIDEDNLGEDEVGAATGLAWTSFGGTTLTIEVSVVHGKGNITLTGKLGDVMIESAKAAITYIRANCEKYGIKEEVFENSDIHIHVPEGATPKDGPSAGITMATAILSAFTNKKVRKDVAMTGEITLRGKVLPIGGLKEKSLAAFRQGIFEIIIPDANKKDIEDIPDNIREKLNFLPVKEVSEVFKTAIRGI